MPDSPDFKTLIAKLSAPDADRCNRDPNSETIDVFRLESLLFSNVRQTLLDTANARPDDRNAIPDELAVLKAIADKTHKDDFGYAIIRIGPNVLVSVNFLGGADFFFFARPSTHASWHVYGGNDASRWFGSGKSINIRPLVSGPPDVQRFLVTTISSGCAGDRVGVTYDVYQWPPNGDDGLKRLITLDGRSNLGGNDADQGLSDERDERVVNWLKAGHAIETKDGRLIMQYCKDSPMDTWDHSSMCGADIYDVRGKVRFIESRYAYPDLWALAAAIDLARKHDRQALAAYVATPALADTLIHADLPDAGDLVEVRKHADGSQDVTMGYIAPDATRTNYTMARRGRNWIVTGYRTVSPG